MTKAQTTIASSSKKLVIYDYEDAWWRLTDNVFDSFHMLDPLLRLFPPVRESHAGPYRYTQDDRTLDQQPELLTYKGSGNADLREGDVEGHTAFIYDFAQSRVKTMAAQTFARVSEVADLMGNTVGADGQPFNVEGFLRAVEKIELQFIGDEDLVVNIIAHPECNPTKCLFVASPGAIVGFVHPGVLPKVTQASWTMEQQQEYDQIIARKRAEQHAAKRTRRLS
jgi:hypothetical protein